MKPILFNTDMVRAILDNRKSVTRRTVKPEPLWRKPPVQQECHPEYWANWDDEKIYKAPYRPGDILYVRETWARCSDLFDEFPDYIFRADFLQCDLEEAKRKKFRWRPSIHMPREAARIFLRVTNVRVEQLYAITGKQARAEGFLSRDAFIRAFLTMYPDCTVKSWVWVIEFERCEKPEEAAS